MQRAHIVLTSLTALVLFAAPVAKANPIVGGYTANTLAANDDNSSGRVAIGFNFNFFGSTYSHLWVNNNGNVTFSAPLGTFTPTGLTTALANPIIAPFFGDVYTGGNSGVVTYEAKTSGVDGHATFGVEWPGVNYYGDATGSKKNTFELLLVDRSDIATGDADIYFNYGSIQWEAGNASGGRNGLGGTCAVAGFSNGSGAAGTNFELPGSHDCGTLIDGGSHALSTATNDGTPGQWLFTVRSGVVEVPPETGVPEPLSVALLGTGLVGLGILRRRRT